jgi:uncharacterized membrane protein YfcA
MLALSGPLQTIDWRWVWLIVAAFLAGVLNAVAGGGSFLSFPALLATGIPPVQANATNTVALWPGQVTSIAAYRDDVRKNLRLALPMGLAGLLGGTAGALVLLSTPQTTFMHLVPWLLLIAAILFALSRPITRWLDQLKAARHRHAVDATPRPPHRILVFFVTILVCFYIGYFGAGAGFLIMTMLSVFGFEDLNEINALIAFLIFVIGNQVEWRYCLLAMVACAIGGYTSARFARLIPQPVLRGIVIGIGFTMAGWYFWKTR